MVRKRKKHSAALIKRAFFIQASAWCRGLDPCQGSGGRARQQSLLECEAEPHEGGEADRARYTWIKTKLGEYKNSPKLCLALPRPSKNPANSNSPIPRFTLFLRIIQSPKNKIPKEKNKIEKSYQKVTLRSDCGRFGRIAYSMRHVCCRSRGLYLALCRNCRCECAGGVSSQGRDSWKPGQRAFRSREIIFRYRQDLKGKVLRISCFQKGQGRDCLVQDSVYFIQDRMGNQHAQQSDRGQ